jgi:precorrin-8X/cobalt-precorrin-8 methylmutase
MPGHGASSSRFGGFMTSDMRQMTPLGRGIEDSSFAIIDAEVGAHGLPPAEWQVVRRVIHATADFEFLSLMQLSGDAVTSGIQALRRGCPVIVDVRMIAVGLNEQRLASYGCEVFSFISDEDVIAQAKASNTTRAIESMRKAHGLRLLDGAVVAIGNAPTALLEVLRLVRDEGARPALVIGVPVGFVSAAESKEALIASTVPFIAARGRKGGSPIAVAIIHALLLLSTDENGGAS